MITKRLFSPKCQHVDRDLVFREDLDNFYIEFISWLNNQNLLNNPIIKDNSNNLEENKQNPEDLFNFENINKQEISYDKNNENFSSNQIKKNKIKSFIFPNKNSQQNNMNIDFVMEPLSNDKNNSSQENLSEDFNSKKITKITNFQKEKFNIQNFKDSTNKINSNNNIFSEFPYQNCNNFYEIDDLSLDILLKKLNYLNFKIFWKEKKMSMLHFCKSKEENYKEFYEVLFGEIQSFLIENNLKRKKNYDNLYLLIQILSIYTFYSVYFTQTADFFYQINTIPEYLIKINQIIKILIKKNYHQIYKELLMMIFRLHKADAFSIGILPGLKTIILNKYGLPCEQKTNTYNDYMDISNNYKNFLVKEDDSQLNNLIHQYKNSKMNTLNNIKFSINEEGFDKEIYCNYINSKNKMVECTKNDLAFLKIDNLELEKKMNNLDLQFNIFDNFI